MKHTKQLLTLLCLAALLLPLLSACGSLDLDANGSWGDLSWSYSRDTKTLTVSGTGAMEDFESAGDVPWQLVRDHATELVIGEGVTSIGSYAFYYMHALTTVQLPSSLTAIGDHAFSFCRSLTAVSFPETMSAIGKEAFVGCNGLDSLYLPPSVTTVGEGAFYGCHTLKSVMITAREVTLGKGAFRDCPSLKRLSLRTTVSDKAIPEDLLKGTLLTIPEIVRTDELVSPTTLTIVYVLEGEEIDRYEESYGYGTSYYVPSPKQEGYVAKPSLVSGAANGKDREVTVTYEVIAPEEAPKVAISSLSMIGTVIMAVALLAIGATVFLLIRTKPKKSKTQ